MMGLLLRLYPREYRREFGAEIVAVHEQAAAEASPAGRLREVADIAGHAVRMRLGVSSATAAGRLLASAAPFAVGAAVAGSAVRLSRWGIAAVVSPGPVYFSADAWGALLLASVLVLVGGVTALTGRWPAGAAVLTAGLLAVAVAAVVSGPAFGDPVVTPAMALLTVLVVLACPPDLRPGAGPCAVAGAMAAVAWLPVTAVHTGAMPVSTDYGLWPLLVLAATGLVVTALAATGLATTWSAGMSPAFAVIAAGPPFLAHAYTTGGWVQLLAGVGIAVAVPPVGALVAGARRFRLRG
ncbi:hypothetical protein AB0P17_41995 [Streptomyces sp. NPDC088124]|uniref:hypothetical protein n=1 Tax=Streptomyces sp. NPDC088124 TaxID=3154654 RepID=UPI0034178645